MSQLIRYSYAPDGVTVKLKRRVAPSTVRNADGDYITGVAEADLPDYGWYPERREPPQPYSDGYAPDPVIDTAARESVYPLRMPTAEVQLQRAKDMKRGWAIMDRDSDLRAWVSADVSGAMMLYNIGTERRSDYIALPAMLDAADAADPSGAPHATSITVRDPATQAEIAIQHTAQQVRGLLQVGMGYMQAVYHLYHQRLDAIDAATSLADIDAIIIPPGDM